MKRLIPLLLLASGVSIWFIYAGNSPEQDIYSGTIEVDDVAVASKVGGRVIKIHVEEGQEVKTGDVLIELDRETLQARVQEAEAQLESARQKWLELENGTRPEEIQRHKATLEAARHQWELLLNGARPEDITAAMANLEAAKSDMRLAEINEKRQRELFASKDTSADRLDRAVNDLNVARNKVRAAEAQWEQLQKGFRAEEIKAAESQVKAASAALDLALAGPRVETIEQARAEVARAEAALNRSRIDLDETVIRAPLAGVVESSPWEPGDVLAPNQPALTLILFEPLWIRIYLPESRLGKISLNEAVGLRVSSYPNRTFQGQVIQINRKAEFTPRNVQTPETRDDLVFGIKIRIEDPDRLLRPGMIADVSLDRD